MPETTARYFPEMPPQLDGENDGQYTDRLTGADGTGRVPYDHPRNRQCSIGFHVECSERHVRYGDQCRCPCHTAEGKLEMRLHEMEESLVAAYAIASGQLGSDRPTHPGWSDRILAGTANEVAEITARRPKLAQWYLHAKESTDA
jgi:hypothetical protein